jgi:hypothetical protein
MENKFLKVLKWFGISILIAFIGLVIIRSIYFFNLHRTEDQIKKIHATKLTMDDVMGKNLPPDPGPNADITIQGIDVNNNGIRDDVELAVFKEYPNSAKTRAVLLQYALALQMEFTQPIINEGIATAIAEEENRSFMCLGDFYKKETIAETLKITEEITKYLEKIQLNIPNRINYNKDFYKKVRSFSSLGRDCDIDLNSLSN